MAAALIPAGYVPIARTDADWAFDITFQDEDWTGAGVSVVMARRGLPTHAVEFTVGDGVLAPANDLSVALRVPAARLADMPPGLYSAEVRRIDGEDTDDAAVFEMRLERGLAEHLIEARPAGVALGDAGVAQGGVIVSRTTRVQVVRAGGVQGKPGASDAASVTLTAEQGALFGGAATLAEALAFIAQNMGAQPLPVLVELAGQIVVSSVATGALSVEAADAILLSGAISVTSSATGALSVEEAEAVLLAGAVIATSSLAGELSVEAGGELIGGVPIGAPGDGALAGYRLVAGDDFAGDLDIITPAEPFGTYGSTRAYLLPTNANGPRGAVGGLSLKGYDVDPFHTGHNDKNRGAARASWADSMVQQDSVLKLKVRTASTAERALFNADLNVNNIAAMIHTAGELIFKPPFHIEFRARLTKAQLAMGGFHPSFWLMQMDPPRSGDGLEIDWEGESDLIEANYFDWSGGTSTASKGGNIDTVYDGQFHTFGLEVTATHLRWFYDGSLFREQAKILQFPDKPFYALVTSHVTNFASDPYSDANWTAAGSEGASIDLDYIRLWQPAEAVKREPMLPPAEYEADAGKAFSFTLPPAVEVWGAAINERVEAFISESNSPGGNYNGGFSGWPAGISYNPATRVLSGSTTQPGTLHIVRYPLEGGSARPQRIALHIGPRLSSTTWPNAKVGQAYEFDLYAACDAGQLTSDQSGQRAKTITVAGLPAGLSCSDSTGMVTGTPTAAGSASPKVTITNSRGQSSGEVTAGLTISAATSADVSPVTTGLILDLDPNDPAKRTTTASGSDVLVDSISPANGTTYGATATGTQRPKLISANGRSILRADGAQRMAIDPAFAALFSASAGYTLMVLASYDTGANQTIMDIGQSGSTSSLNRINILRTSTDGLVHRKAPVSGAFIQAAASGVPLATLNAIVAHSPSGSSVTKVRGNGNSAVSPGAAAFSSANTATLFDRTSTSSALPLTGTIARVLAWNRELSDAETDALIAWAKDRYGTP